MENIRDNGFDELLALCGGCCSCATCHVHVDPDWMAKLGRRSATRTICSTRPITRPTNSRLSCQILYTAELDGLRVQIAPED